MPVARRRLRRPPRRVLWRPAVNPASGAERVRVERRGRDTDLDPATIETDPASVERVIAAERTTCAHDGGIERLRAFGEAAPDKVGATVTQARKDEPTRATSPPSTQGSRPRAPTQVRSPTNGPSPALRSPTHDAGPVAAGEPPTTTTNAQENDHGISSQDATGAAKGRAGGRPRRGTPRHPRAQRRCGARHVVRPGDGERPRAVRACERHHDGPALRARLAKGAAANSGGCSPPARGWTPPG